MARWTPAWDGLKLGSIADALALPEDGFDAIVAGQLHRLQAQGKVHQPGGERMEWAPTDAEREHRQHGLNTENTE